MGARGWTTRLDPSRTTLLMGGLIAAGTLLRLYLAASAAPVPFDLHSQDLAAQALRGQHLHFYSAVNAGGHGAPPRWPYPPGYLPWLLLSSPISQATGLGLHFLYRLPAIAADGAIAWIVQGALARRGARPGTRLAAVALVAFGPCFVATSAWHGQIDSLAILPALAATLIWQGHRTEQRALLSGALIGIGAALKTIPIVMVFALVPTARRWSEAVRLAGFAIAVPLLALLPFLVADFHGATGVLRYHGEIGLGGLSLPVQPDLAPRWFGFAGPRPSAISIALADHGAVLTAAGVLLTSVFAWRRRLPAVSAAVLIWLAVYAFGTTFFLQYIVWGLPFFLLAGFIREVAVLQLVLLGPVLLRYLGPSSEWQVWAFYVGPMLLLWAVLVIAYAVMMRRAGRDAARLQPSFS